MKEMRQQQGGDHSHTRKVRLSRSAFSGMEERCGSPRELNADLLFLRDRRELVRINDLQIITLGDDLYEFAADLNAYSLELVGD